MLDRVLAVATAAGLLLMSGDLGVPSARAAAGPPPAPALGPAAADRVLVKFRGGARVRLRNGELVSLTGAGTLDVSAALAAVGASAPERLFGQAEAAIDRDRAAIQASSGTALPDLNSYFALETSPGLGGALAWSLRSLPSVETAYLAAAPAPPPAARAFVAAQGYREAAPSGVGVDEAASFPGAAGDQVMVVDIEYDWNRSHEDLSGAGRSSALIPNGTPINPFPEDDHGTAVLGQIVGDPDDRGVTGLVPEARLGLVNSWNEEAGPVLADAINVARQHMSPGDVMLIEQQLPGLRPSEYLPVEWDPAVYDAIRLATAAGIVVVEPAGNGSVDLDASAYGASFPMGKADSGALMVGAGAAGHCDPRGLPALSRLPFSNHGSPVDLQGWGECVTTTGYGDLTAGESDPNRWYTGEFSGTSSAAAMVAAAAAALQSAHKTLNDGEALQPAEVRDILVQTGTPQELSGAGAAAGHIGPLPNLARALPRVDLTAPTTPTGLRVSAADDGRPLLSWTAATDNVASGYEIYRDRELIAVTELGASPRFDDATASAGTAHTYTVRAVDGAGNRSPHSNAATRPLPAPPTVEPPPAPETPPAQPAIAPPTGPAPEGGAPTSPPAPADPAAAPAAAAAGAAAAPAEAAPAPTPPPAPPVAAAAAVAPRLSGLRAVPARLVLRRSRRSLTTIRFSLSAPAPVWLRVSARSGRGKGRLLGRLRVAGHAGRNTVALRGRPLPAGAYAIVVRVVRGPPARR